MDWIKFTEIQGRLELNFSAGQYTGRSPIDAAVSAVDRIVAKYPGPYTLFASGGIDSQSMIYSWMKSGHNFDIVSVRYENNFNAHDLEILQVFAYEHNINVKYLDFEVLPFLDRLQDYAVPYQCTSPQICTHMAISELVPTGTVIFSGNPIINSTVSLNRTILGLHRYAEKSRPGSMIPFFFMHDPELAVSFIRPLEKISVDSAKSSQNQLSSYYIKYLLYKMTGFDIIPQSQKLTGFEKIKEHFDSQRHLVSNRERIEFATRPSKRVFDQVYRYRWEKIIKYHDALKVIF